MLPNRIKMPFTVKAKYNILTLTILIIVMCINSCGTTEEKISGKKTVQVNDKPNVLLILVDDLKPTLGAYGDPTAISPNIDKLANKGMRFDMAYCNQAVCGPSRYNLLLGSRSTSTGFYNFDSDFRQTLPDAVTLPQYFMNYGYHTESMGKVYHIGHGMEGDDASWSIPHHKEKVIEYILTESTGGKLTREEAFFENTRKYIKDTPKNSELPRGAAWESPEVVDDAYADGRVARHAIDRMRELVKNPDQPFFMAVGFARPHLPFSVPKKYWDMYDSEKLPLPEYESFPQDAPKWATKRRGEITQFFPVPEDDTDYSEGLKRNLIHGYYASMSYMDAQVGKVMDELERLGLAKNTIVVLWGDHGWHLGDHGSWTKHTNYEQATRIPILVCAPGITTPGSASDQPIETVDIYPTLADLAGLPSPQGPQPIDGLSMLPVLKNPENIIRNHAYHSFPKQGYIGQAIRTNKYRFVLWRDPAGEKEDVMELYDMINDPLETKNLSGEKTDVINEMITIINSHPKPTEIVKGK